jgi:hypothetical protein
MIDVWKEKVLLYKDLVSEIPNTLSPTSATWAKKHIFGFSDEDIKLDTQQQRLERAVAAELANTATVITHTGMFDVVDKLYKTKSGSTVNPPAGGEASAGGGGGGSFGGGSLPDFGGGGESSPEPSLPPLGGEEGGGAPEAPAAPGAPPEEEETLPEGKKNDNLNILLESDDIHGDKYIDLSKGRNSLGSIENELSKLLRD